jgi:hypothetical protein
MGYETSAKIVVTNENCQINYYVKDQALAWGREAILVDVGEVISNTDGIEKISQE